MTTTVKMKLVLTKHNGYANITNMNKFNTSKNTFNKNIMSKELEAYSNEIGNKIKDAKEKEEKRRKRDQKLLGAGAIALALGTGFNHFLPANTETEPANNHETGVHSIDVSDFDTYESPADGDTITINLKDGARLRSAPKVTGNHEPPNLLHEVEEGGRTIDINYEVSKQEDIPIAHHEGYNNPDWIGIPVEELPEDLQAKLSSDSDGLVWVSSAKAKAYIGDTKSDDIEPVEVR